MNISELFILRPVMTTLVTAAMLIFGVFGYSSLPVSELPRVDYPFIVVNANLPGAQPQTMASSVATPIESQLSQIAGIESMTSTSTLGNTQITIQFSLDRDIDAASQDVQQALSVVTRRLPRQMTSPPTLRKQNPADAPILLLAMSSPSLPLSKVDEYSNLLFRQVSVINGVANVLVFGSQKYAVRIQADPAALTARGIGIDRLASAVDAANANLATGSLNGPSRAAVINVNGQLNTAHEFARQVVVYQDGAPVRLSDVAQVSDSVENIRTANWFNGKRSIVLAVFRQPGANTIQVVDDIKRLLPQFMQQLPASMTLETVYDRSQSIRASVEDVQTTLIIAAALVIAVIFLFLRTLRATVIPSLALPIAVIGTFAGMSFLGFSLDNLSLMALTLSVGFVVDDAIVMLENTVRHIERGETAFDAALKSSREIGFTILSMTVSMAAVFIPVMFMGGIVGRLLSEFAITIVMAILISGVVSVTLTPMLCSRFLKDQHSEQNVIQRWSERTFNAMQGAYDRSLQWSLHNRRLVLMVFLGSLAASVTLFATMPQDFIPSADIGMIQGSTEAANGTSFEQMKKYQQKIAAILQNDPNIDSVMSRNDTNTGGFFIRLKDRSERSLSAEQIIDELRPKTARVPGVNSFFRNPPSINVSGLRTNSQYQYSLQDIDLDKLQDATVRLTAALRDEPGFQDVDNDLRLTTPTVAVSIDRDRAASLGVTPQSIEVALGTAFGGQQVSQIYGSSDQYAVIMELEPRYQADPSALSRVYVTSQSGTLVPLTAVTTIGSSTTPQSVNHLGQLPAATISFNLSSGIALSQALAAIERAKREVGIPDSVRTSAQGTAKAFQSSMSNATMLLIIAIIVVYIVLGILYESFVHPLTILSGLPSAAVGALITLLVFDIPLSLYAFVGMIMLIGIVKKNAILMIDFALARQRGEGVDAAGAIYEAAVVRFRPIMMTTMAAMMGTLPIAIGLGAGSETRRPLGLAVVGGLLLSQLLTLYITPVIYVYLEQLSARLKTRGISLQPRHAT